MLFKKKEEIEDWLNKYNIIDYKLIKSDEYGYVINVNNDVVIWNKNLKSIDIKFNIVEGDFNCAANELKSLKGCPEIINGGFYCNNNKLKTLENCPEIIKKSFSCNNNQLKSLKNGPKTVNGDYDCQNNYLTTLEGCLEIITGNFDCSNNDLMSLEGSPKIVKGDFGCSNNRLTSLKGCPEIIEENFWCVNNLLEIECLKYLPKEIKTNYIDIINNKNLSDLQYINDFNELKEKVRILLEKENLLSIINKDNLNYKNKSIKKFNRI